jgi:hypothetical protein
MNSIARNSNQNGGGRRSKVSVTIPAAIVIDATELLGVS